MSPTPPASAPRGTTAAAGTDLSEAPVRNVGDRPRTVTEPPPDDQRHLLDELGWLAARTAARARRRARRRVAGADQLPYHPEPGLPADTTVTTAPGAPDWACPVLSALTTSGVILSPQHGPDGEIVDFTVVAGNVLGHESRARSPGTFVGRTLGEARPGIRAGGLYDFYAEVLADGQPRRFENLEYLDVIDSRPIVAHADGTVSPYQGMLLVTWWARDRSGLSERVQSSSRMGWAEWDLLTGQVYASSGLRSLLHLPAASEWTPADATQLGRLLDPRDLAAFTRHVRRLLSGQEISESQVTVHAGGEERVLRWLGQPSGGERDGPPESLLFTVRDITEHHREQQELERARETAQRLRQEAAAERRVSETLRRALTPQLPELTQPGMTVAAGYLPWDQRVGGDWYKCRPLPDGRFLLAIGDASGHGVNAASRAVQQRAALAGLAYTHGDAAQLATHLGEVVYDDGMDTTATAVLGHFDSRDFTFRWASAGHPAPVLVRDGEAQLLPTEQGMLLGVDPEAVYEVTTTQLRSGDLLLLYTDGMVERRGQDVDEGMQELLDVAGTRRWQDASSAVEVLMSALVGPSTDDDVTLLAVHLS